MPARGGSPGQRGHVDVPLVLKGSARPTPTAIYFGVSRDNTDLRIGTIPEAALSADGVAPGGFIGRPTEIFEIVDGLDALEGRVRTTQPDHDQPVFDEVKVGPLGAPAGGAAMALFVGSPALSAAHVIELVFTVRRRVALGVSADQGGHVQAFASSLDPVPNPARDRPSAYVLVSFGARDARVAGVAKGGRVRKLEWQGRASAAEIVAAARAAASSLGPQPPVWILVRKDATYESMVGLLDSLSAVGSPELTLTKYDPADVRTANVELRLGTPTTTGRIDLLERDVRRNYSRLLVCYLDQAEARPDLGDGDIELHLALESNGHVASADARGYDDAVANCVADALRDVRFARSHDGRPVEVTYPLTFEHAPKSLDPSN